MGRRSRSGNPAVAAVQRAFDLPSVAQLERQVAALRGEDLVEQDPQAARADVESRCRRVVVLRARVAADEAEAVRRGRRLGRSWGDLGALLETPGETLRRRYGP